MPTAATTQRLPAVVKPRTDRPSRRIAPAPRKPIPVTTCAATRVGSTREPKSLKPYAPTSVNRAAPSDTSRCVRTPASRSRISRSTPTAAPRPAATASRSSTSAPPSEPRLLARSIDRLSLDELELLDPGRGEVEQLVELLAVERHALCGRLHLDEAAVARDDDVHVGVGGRVLRVVEVEQRFTADDADRDGQHLREGEAVERAVGGDIGAADRSATGATVGLQDVAVQVDRSLAERLEIDHRAQRPADQALDLDRPAALPPARRLPLRPVAGRGRKQRVLSRHPATAALVEPARHPLRDRRGTEDAGLPLRPEHHPVRLFEKGRVGDNRAELVGPPAVGPGHAARSSSASATRSTSPSGS